MFDSDIEFKKDLMKHNIFTSWQYIQNAKKNIEIASFSATTITNIISEMTNETVSWKQNIFSGFLDGEEKQIARTTDNMPNYQVDIGGTIVSSFFLVDKLIKDFYQYSRNLFDSIGQIANSGLLVNKGKKIDSIDFPAMEKRLNQAMYKEPFPKTAKWFEVTKDSSEFRYIDAINNRIKHTAEVSNKLSMGILGSPDNAEIGPFFRKDEQIEKRDLESQLLATLGFLNDSLQEFLTAFCLEYPKDMYSENRNYKISVYQQKMRELAGATFSYAYIQSVGSFQTMPDKIRILLIKEYDDDVIARVSPFEVLLITGGAETDILGRYIADEEIGDDCMLRYRKYKKDTSTDASLCKIIEMRKANPIFYHRNPFFNIKVVSDDDEFLKRSSLPF